MNTKTWYGAARYRAAIYGAAMLSGLLVQGSAGASEDFRPPRSEETSGPLSLRSEANTDREPTAEGNRDETELAGKCTSHAMGGPTSCKTVPTWKSYANSDCKAMGKRLTSYAPQTLCGKALYRGVVYQCC